VPGCERGAQEQHVAVAVTAAKLETEVGSSLNEKTGDQASAAIASISQVSWEERRRMSKHATCKLYGPHIHMRSPLLVVPTPQPDVLISPEAENKSGDLPTAGRASSGPGCTRRLVDVQAKQRPRRERLCGDGVSPVPAPLTRAPCAEPYASCTAEIVTRGSSCCQRANRIP
jgi:hypothetical protein